MPALFSLSVRGDLIKRIPKGRIDFVDSLCFAKYLGDLEKVKVISESAKFPSEAVMGDNDEMVSLRVKCYTF